MNTQTPEINNEEPIVLLIDDSIDVHRLLAARLRTEPIQLICASTGADGLEIAKQIAPAVILLDLDMPEIDGFTVLRQLKDNTDTVEVPVLVLSGLTGTQDKVTAFDLGAVDYITKPFDIIELRVRIRSALKMSNLINMLNKRAQIDGLTGLWNRVYFDQRLEELTTAVSRTNHALSIGVIDLDHFKSINDTYGHPAGDTVIQGLAGILNDTCRGTDICCRYGGEEFVILMPNTDPQEAVNLCERIRELLKAKRWSRHPNRPVTASFGVTGVAKDMSCARPASEWLEAADGNLYKAKQGGRDRVEATSIDSGVRLAEAG